MSKLKVAKCFKFFGELSNEIIYDNGPVYLSKFYDNLKRMIELDLSLVKPLDDIN